MTSPAGCWGCASQIQLCPSQFFAKFSTAGKYVSNTPSSGQRDFCDAINRRAQVPIRRISSEQESQKPDLVQSLSAPAWKSGAWLLSTADDRQLRAEISGLTMVIAHGALGDSHRPNTRHDPELGPSCLAGQGGMSRRYQDSWRFLKVQPNERLPVPPDDHRVVVPAT